MLGKLVLSTCFHSSRNASLEHSASPFQAVSHSVPLDEAEDPTLDNRWFSWPELEREEQRARDKCHKAMRKARKAAQAGAVLEMTPVIVASTLDSRAWAISASIVITLFKSSWFTELTAFALSCAAPFSQTSSTGPGERMQCLWKAFSDMSEWRGN